MSRQKKIKSTSIDTNRLLAWLQFVARQLEHLADQILEDSK